MLATFARAPELELTPAEAQTLAHGMAEVNRHYRIPAMDPGHVAIGSLATAAFVIYRGKFKAMNARRSGRQDGAAGSPVSTDAPTIGGASAPIVAPANGKAPNGASLNGSPENVAGWFDFTKNAAVN